MKYPPFGFATTPADPGDDPLVGVDLVPQLEERNRLTTAFRLILAIPRLIVMSMLGIALCVVGLIACFAVLFTPGGHRACETSRWVSVASSKQYLGWNS